MHAIDMKAEPRDDLSTIDLNLLVALEAFLEERSVTRAAARLRVGQPAASHALRRLRVTLGDPLLVRAGRQLTLTPRAEALRPLLATALASVRAVLVSEHHFDPARSSRAFTLVCPDILFALAPELAGALGTEAPRVRLHVRAPANVDVDVQLASGGADLALGPAPDSGATGLVIRALGKVELAVLARRDHPAIRDGAIDVDGWLAHPHVRIRTGETPSLIDAAIEAAGRERHVGFVAPSFLVAPFVVARTDMFFTAPRALTVGLARLLDLAMLEPPIRIPPIPVALAWHERSHHDEGHRWLRARVVSVAQRVLREGLALTGVPATSEKRAPPERRGRSARARR